jgi:hypothetical protein
MMYRINIKGTGRIETIELDRTARPITAYIEGQVIPNTVYAIITKEKMGTGDCLAIKLLDMSVKIPNRITYLKVLLFAYDPKPDQAGFDTEKVKIETGLGSLSEYLSETERWLLKSIWLKGLPKLYNILKDVQESYCQKKFAGFTPWISKLNNEGVSYFKNRLSVYMGRIVYEN